MFSNICSPALVYLIFSITQVILDSYKGLYNLALVKISISLLFTILLNILCKRGHGIFAWIIVTVPFFLLTIISSLLLLYFGYLQLLNV